MTYLPATVAWPGGLTSHSDFILSLTPGLAVLLDFIHEYEDFHG